MKTKDDFHKLIDSIQDENRLKDYFDLINGLNENQSGNLWNALTPEQQKELLSSYDESHDAKNLIHHEDARKDFDKWLKK